MLSWWWRGASVPAIVVYFWSSYVTIAVGQQLSSDVNEARMFLEYYDNLAAQTWPGIVTKLWNFNFNITEFTRSEMVRIFLIQCSINKTNSFVHTT